MVWDGFGGQKNPHSAVIRAYLQGGSQESGRRRGERLRNGLGRDFLEKSLRDPVSEGFRLKNQKERDKCCRFIWSNQKKNKILQKTKFCTYIFDPQCNTMDRTIVEDPLKTLRMLLRALCFPRGARPPRNPNLCIVLRRILRIL